jgi:hydrogenase nickel incorporation protein HypA/HybF
MPDALSFAFEAMTQDGPLKGVVLEMKELPVIARCEECSFEFKPTDFPYICPECGCRFYSIIQGEDIYIESIDCEI